MSSQSSRQLIEFPKTTAVVHTLDNGLEVIIKEDHSAPVVSIQAWCRAGSIHEGDWLGAGMSHFLEHMLFKGTDKRSTSEIAKEIQANGGYVNAYTSLDRTVYWIDSPSSGFENCLDVLCDLVTNSRIPEDEFDKEQEVIRREFAMGDDNPGDVLGKMLFSKAYAVHPCRHPVIGHIDIFDQLNRDDLYRYYQEKYTPDNLFIVIAGDIDSAEVLGLIETHLGGMKRRRRPAMVLPHEPLQFGMREEVREFPTEIARSRISWQIPDLTHPDSAALNLLASLLGGGRSSRLYQAIRENKQLAYSIHTYAYTPEFRGIFVLGIETDLEKLVDAEQAAWAEIEKLKEEGITEQELHRVRNQCLSAQISTLASMNGQASDLGSNWLSTRNLDYTRDYVEASQKVTCDKVKEVASRYLVPDAYTRVALIPTREKTSRPTHLHSNRSEDIRKLELTNGLTVLLLSDRRVPFVQGKVAFRGGQLAQDRSSSGLANLMGRLLTKDTRKRSSVVLAGEIESAGGGISAMAGSNTFGVSAGALKLDLDLVVDVLGEAILEPLFLAEVVEKEKKIQLASIKAELDHPFSVGMKRFRTEFFGDHPYGLPDFGTPETVTSFSPQTLSDFRERLVLGGNGVIGLFGDLDLAEAEDLIRARFESLPSGPRLFLDAGASLLPESLGQIVELKHEKEQAILLVGFRTFDLFHEDNFAIGLIDEACGDMASRMFIRIREELGLAYSVGSSRMRGLASGFLLFYAATAPDKLDQVQQEMLAEIDSLAKNGLEKEEFDRAKASWLGSQVIHLQGAQELASTATTDELLGLGWDHYRSTEGHIKALTENKIREVAAHYLRDENRVVVRLTT